MKKNLLVMNAALVLSFLLFSGCALQPPARTAKAGDKVLVNYSISLENGSVIDSANVSFIVGKSAAIQGLQDAVAGLREGESKSVSVPPEKAFGEWKPELVRMLQKTYDVSRYSEISFQDFAIKYGADYHVGRTIALNYWNATVVGNGSAVRLRVDPAEGILVSADQLHPFPQRVTQVGADSFTVEIQAQPGDVGSVFNASAGTVTKVRVLNESAGFLLVDTNHELAGKTVVLNVTLIKIA